MNKRTWLIYGMSILAASLGLGALLNTFSGGGNWWIGWGGYSLLLAVVLSSLVAAWRWAGGGRNLAILLLVALLLRLLIGFSLMLLLPQVGYDSPVYASGTLYQDAFNRDQQAWDLAVSGQSLLAAFDKNFSLDQYGGLMLISAFVYRLLSPDLHRAGLLIVLAAGFYSLGAVFLWRTARQLWGEKLAGAAGWFYAFYPEAVLLGSAQMREPFLITFFAMAFWGTTAVQTLHKRSTWLWAALGLAGMLLVSPGVALFALIFLAIWTWLSGGRRAGWKGILAVVAVFLVGLILFLWALGRYESIDASTPLGAIFQWIKYTVLYDVYQLERGSGWVQRLFRELPDWLHLPFVITYGMFQPVLPAAIAEPAPWLIKTIAILRSAGWYLLAPFMLYGLVASARVKESLGRMQWFLIGALAWIWIIISALRGGGDQWDNPRYRAIFILLQVLFAAQAYLAWRSRRDRWFGRLLIIEALFLAIFTEWYSYRYLGAQITPLPMGVMVGSIVLLSILILAAGYLWDRSRWGRRRS